MNKLLWFAGLLLAVSFLFPNGLNFPVTPVTPVPAPEPAPVAPVVDVDAKIVELLANADAADKARIVSVYSGLETVLTRDNGKRINTTEKWSELQARTLEMAIEQVGKYPGLDAAIENVFLTVVGTDDVLPNNGDTQMKLIKACKLIIASAEK